MRDKLTEPDKSTTLADSTEETDKEIPWRSRSQRKLKTRDKPTDAENSTMPVDPMKEANKNFPPMPKASLHAQASANHYIEDTMGCDRLSPPINIGYLETDWNLFELTITGGELKNPQQQSLPIT